MITTEDKSCQSVNEWLTLQEVSCITGKSVNALTLLISRRKIDRIRKINGRGKGKWLIHKDFIGLLPTHDRLTEYDRINHGQTERTDRTETGQTERSTDRADPGIPLHYFDSKLKEWTEERDRLQTGLMMYRYKFEELERQTRLLPAPLEIIPLKLTELEQQEEELKTSQQVINDLEAKLQTRQKAMNELEAELQRERSLTWWQRLWKK